MKTYNFSISIKRRKVGQGINAPIDFFKPFSG